ncbi:MAG: hypothetical protein U9N40_04100 [Euryarchaeota archaeon]|nr:hypothetical protein [Euryarchaeota archaeon]
MKTLTIIIVLMLAFTLLCGCMTEAPESSPQLSEVKLNSSHVNERVTLNAAMADLKIYLSEGEVSTENMTIHLVVGDGVNISGMARTWTLGVTQNNIPSLFVYKNGGWRQTGWGDTFMDDAIDLNATLSPDELYKMKSSVIGDEIRSPDPDLTETQLRLSGGVYSVSTRSETGISELKFNAKTGELI